MSSGGYQVGPQDLRFNRGLALFAFLAGAYFAVVAISRLGAGRGGFSTGAAMSLAVTLLLSGSYLAWCSRFLMRNAGRPTSWFRQWDRSVAPWVNGAVFGAGPAIGLGVLAAYATGALFVSGLLVGPAGLLLLVALGRITGGIRPL